jgi:alpha-galactosidase
VRIEPRGSTAPTGIEVAVDAGEPGGGTLRWSIANATSRPIAVDRVRLRWHLASDGAARMLRHGWQSWSPTGEAVLGRDDDPSRAGAPELVRAMYHPDAAVADPGELRSELVTVVADDHDTVLVGFDGGSRHDGTIRLRQGELVAEAWLGGAVLAAGERRELHAVRVETGDEPAALLASWAAWAGAASAARTGAPFQVGWCSWYQFFHDVTEADIRANLAAAGDWPFEVFQVDDGYQAAIGDWLRPAETFPTPLDGLAADIAAAGHVPGLWLAPFLASPASTLAAEHADWLARHCSGRPLVAMVNAGWGGEALALDTTHPDVQAHLEELARTLVAMGWRYLKLDFTYAPAVAGTWHDPSRTPAERVRLGYDAIRRGAGDDVFLLGCGAPLGPCIGVVDGMRIGPDVAPSWEPDPGGWLPGYDEALPAIANALRATEARRFQHRRLWLNDPDCVLLRTEDTKLTEAQVRRWAEAVGASGGMVLVSDHLPALGPPARRLLEEVLAAGRAADAGL